jgi:PAS domain S-box-containing protein
MKDAPVSQPIDRGLVDAHLSLALEANQMGTWEWDIAANRVAWSAAQERIHGLGAEPGGFEGTFEAFARDIHPADRARMLKSIAEAVSGAREHCLEYRIVRPDGSIRWLETRGRLLRDGEGKPERLVGVCSDITERKEAILRLQLSEAFYSATIMSVADAVVTTDPDGRVTLMNGVAESLTGWRLEEARGMRFDDLIRVIAEPAPISDRLTPGPNPASEIACRLTAAPRSAKRLVRRDGSTLAIDDSAAPIRNAQGEVVGRVVVFRDVTEERQDEARRWFIAEASALLTSTLDFEKMLTTIAELAVPRIADWCMVYAVAKDGSLQRLVVAHRDAAKFELAARLQRRAEPGRSPAAEVFRTGKSLFLKEISEEWLRRAVASEEHFELLRGLGLQSCMIVPLRARDRVLGAISFVTSEGPRLDERDLQMAEELGRRAGMAIENARLYEDAQRARIAAENSAARALLIQEVTAALSEAPTPSIVAEVVTSLGTKALGAAAASVYRVSSSGDELVLVRSMGHPEELLEGFHRFPMTANLPVVEAVKTGRPMFFRQRQELDKPYPGLVGPIATFTSWAALPLEVEGRRLGALGISFRDAREFDETARDFMVTVSRLCAQALERANLYEAAQKARAEAESARRTRENLLAVVSHDLRNPLSAIATTASLLLKADPARETRERLVRYGSNILRTAQRMDRLIVDLLDLAKIESGRLLLEPQRHEVGSLVKDSVEILAPVANGKGVQLIADVSAAGVDIFCDRERVLQVLSNLIGNALKFTAEGGAIAVSAREREGEATFAVSDTGCGIGADQLPHIFDRYWQAKHAREGIGLGLSIAKGIVEAHGGRIWVETKLEQGTTFFFTLPKNPRSPSEPSEDGAVKI